MGRRWTTNQYMDRYWRRMERRAFYRDWDNAHQPKSPDGTRKCVNCVYDASCDRPRKGNHLYCFRPGNGQEQNRTPAREQEIGTAGKVFSVIIVLLLIIPFLIIIFSGGFRGGLTILSFLFLMFILFASAH